MKKNWTCSATALALTLASCFIRQFMIIHFYSELTSNHHRVFVITSFCDHMWNLVVYCCENMLFIAFYMHKLSFQMHWFNSRKSLFYIIYSGCCHVYFCCVKAFMCMLWLKLSLLIHISKMIYFQFVYIHFGWLRYIIKVAQKNATHGYNFSCDCIYKIARLLCRYPGNTVRCRAAVPHHTRQITFVNAISARSWGQTL